MCGMRSWPLSSCCHHGQAPAGLRSSQPLVNVLTTRSPNHPTHRIASHPTPLTSAACPCSHARSVWVEPNSVADLLGNRNTGNASLTVLYRAPSDALDGVAVAANVAFGALMAGCLGATHLTAWLQPYAPGDWMETTGEWVCVWVC